MKGSQDKAMRHYEQTPMKELETQSARLAELAKTGEIKDGQRTERRRVNQVLGDKRAVAAYSAERKKTGRSPHEHHEGQQESVAYQRGYDDGVLGLLDQSDRLDGWKAQMDYGRGFGIGKLKYYEQLEESKGRADGYRDARRGFEDASDFYVGHAYKGYVAGYKLGVRDSMA